MENEIVAHEVWVARRTELLAAERELARLRDEVSRRRRELPWECARRNYVFDGVDGRETLSGLFAGRSRLVIYHFAWAAEWEGGEACVRAAEKLDACVAELAARGVTAVGVSHAAVTEIGAMRRRRGWSFKWVSSLNNDFSVDYGVTFAKEEASGVSVFCKNELGEIFHAYSNYECDVEELLGANFFLELAGKEGDGEGRVEEFCGVGGKDVRKKLVDGEHAETWAPSWRAGRE